MDDVKRFFDIFKRYEPSSSDKRMLLQKGGAVKVMRTLEPFRVEVHMDFSEPINYRTLWAVEEECRQFYNAVSFRILPHFPPEMFSVEVMPDIVDEAVRVGAATHGFFDHARYREEGETILAEIPFLADGVGIVKNTDTETILSNIIFSRFGVRRQVVVKEAYDAKEKTEQRQEAKRKLEEEYDRQAMMSYRQAQSAIADGGVPVPEEAKLPRISGLTEDINRFEMLDSTTYAPLRSPWIKAW